jgi:hypothetical protein
MRERFDEQAVGRGSGQKQMQVGSCWSSAHTEFGFYGGFRSRDRQNWSACLLFAVASASLWSSLDVWRTTVEGEKVEGRRMEDNCLGAWQTAQRNTTQLPRGAEHDRTRRDGPARRQRIERRGGKGAEP